jgi:hypothetical protein
LAPEHEQSQHREVEKVSRSKPYRDGQPVRHVTRFVQRNGQSEGEYRTQSAGKPESRKLMGEAGPSYHLSHPHPAQ